MECITENLFKIKTLAFFLNNFKYALAGLNSVDGACLADSDHWVTSGIGLGIFILHAAYFTHGLVEVQIVQGHVQGLFSSLGKQALAQCDLQRWDSIGVHKTVIESCERLSKIIF